MLNKFLEGVLRALKAELTSFSVIPRLKEARNIEKRGST
jgi:hypothetical protein